MTTKNLVSDFGAVADGVRTTVTATITSGTKGLTVASGIFTSGDVGKSLTLWNAVFSPNGGGQNNTIASFTSSTQVTMTNNWSQSVAAGSCEMLYGTDNASAFTGVSGWRAWAQTQTNPADPPVLQIPDGNFAAVFSASPGGAINYNVLNSPKLTGISGVAANCRLMQLSMQEIRFGMDPACVPNRGLTNSGGNSARLLSASRGATSVFLSNPSGLDSGSSTYGSRIVVGRTCLVAAFDMQGTYEGSFGYPPNQFFFEYNTITAYNSGTGEVTLQTPLTQAYKSTYPRWGTENTIFNGDQGGPATIWVCPDGYGNTVTLENFTVDNTNNQSAAHYRYIVLNNLVMNGPALYPTQCDTFTANSCVYPQSLEIDKLVNLTTWNNCTLQKLQQQSASPNRNIVNGGTIDTLEAAKYTEANNVAFTNAAQIICGVSSYGRADQIVLSSCTNITTFQRGGISTDDLNGSSGTGSKANASDFYTFVSGVLKFAKTLNDSHGNDPANTGQQNLTRWAMPGTWVLFDDKYIDQVVDCYEDGTYCYIQFKNTTSWPFTPVRFITVHSCPDFTMNNCTGSAAELEDWNSAPKRIPLYSYSKRIYTDDATGTTGKTKPSLIGRLSTHKLNVTTPGSVTFEQSQFNNWSTAKTDYTTFSYGPTIACVNGGLRTVNGGTTASGAQGSDSLPNLTATGQIWFYGTSNSSPMFSLNNTNAVISSEFTMDQGIPPAVPTAVVPLRLRLHA